MIDERSPYNHDYLVTRENSDIKERGFSSHYQKPMATDADRKQWSEQRKFETTGIYKECNNCGLDEEPTIDGLCFPCTTRLFTMHA